MAIREKEIVNQFMANVWLYEKTFGKLLDFIARETETEERRNLLKNVYWYTDIDYVIPKRLDRKALEKKTKILFNYNNKDDGSWEQPRKGFFG